MTTARTGLILFVQVVVATVFLVAVIHALAHSSAMVTVYGHAR